MNTKYLLAIGIGIVAGYALSKKLKPSTPWAQAYVQGVKLAGVAA